MGQAKNNPLSIAKKMGHELNKDNSGNVTIMIDIKDTETLVCLNCGSEDFSQVINLRKLSALHPKNPTKQDNITAMQKGYVCIKCGTGNRIGTMAEFEALKEKEDVDV